MTAIEAVASRVPGDAVPVERALADEGLDERAITFHRRVFGNVAVRREPPDSPVSWEDMVAEAVGRLDGLRGREGRVRYLVHARTIAIGAHGADPLGRLRDRLGLPAASTFSISQQACASGLLAVAMCGRLLAADGDPDALALVVSGERTFSPVTRLMGPAVLAEGVAAALVGAHGDPVLGYATRTHAEFNDALGTPAELADRFSEVNPAALEGVVTEALDAAGLAPDDVALVVPHNVSLVGWQRLARGLGLPIERFFLDNLADVGHCFCADPFLNYRAAVDRGLLRPGDRYVLTSLGAGVVWAAMVLEYRGGPSGPAVSDHVRGEPSAVRQEVGT